MSGIIGAIALALLIAIAVYSVKTDRKQANSVTPLDDNENMLTFWRARPDHRVSTADTVYEEHRSY